MISTIGKDMQRTNIKDYQGQEAESKAPSPLKSSGSNELRVLGIAKKSFHGFSVQ
jgi:hypothetical protein